VYTAWQKFLGTEGTFGTIPPFYVVRSALERQAFFAQTFPQHHKSVDHIELFCAADIVVSR
jgi:hypothetical protein